MLTARTKQLGRRAVVDPKILLPVLVTFLFALAILGAENDLGFAMLLFALFLSLLWITTGRVAYVVGGVGLLAVGGFVMSKFFYQIHQRISVWLNPWTTHAYSHGGQQILGGWFSMASGGLTGTGLGLGQGGRWVGQWTSDMIFTAIGEELGLLGIIVVLSAIIMIVAEGFRIAQRSHSDFARLVATSLSVIIGFQTFFIAAGVLRLLPLTGITLPFVAFGGSSLISNYVIIGMLFRMSHEAETESHGGFVRQLETA
jgi:peptidoglycan glycosyltransferase